jgi:hypothetical protein
MFIEGAFDTDSVDKKTLECSPIEEAKIRNHTCVLSPETTQGPYYHDRGHPIRQNMAEDQLGLLFVSSALAAARLAFELEDCADR